MEFKAKRVSVLMGLYNCAPTLREALDSLLNQTYQNFKVVMCDDGSSDITNNIAKEYVDNYPDRFILIFNKENKGLNYTLNRCLEYADTELIARMDGDDISLPTRFEKQIDFLDKNPDIAVVSTPMLHFDENGVFKIGKGGKLIKKEDFLNGSPINHAPCIMRTNALKDVGGYSVSKNLLRVEDYHLWFKLFKQKFKLYLMDEPLYMMRDGREAASRRSFSNRLNISRLQFSWFPKIGLPWWSRFYAIKPILIWLIPAPLYSYLRKKTSKN